MPGERKGANASTVAAGRTGQIAQRPPLPENFSEELRRRAGVRRAEVALVSSYLRALRRLGEVPIGPPRPEVPH